MRDIMASKKEYKFKAELIKNPDMDASYIIFPYDIRDEFNKGRVKVHAEFDGELSDQPVESFVVALLVCRHILLWQLAHEMNYLQVEVIVSREFCPEILASKFPIHLGLPAARFFLPAVGIAYDRLVAGLGLLCQFGCRHKILLLTLLAVCIED